MKKRLLSALLALCMVLTMVPAAFAVDDADTGSSTQTENSVASVTVNTGTKYYDTLGGAIDAAETGATVKLLKDVEDGDGVIVSGEGNRTLTIDFNGRSYTVTSDLAGSSGTKSQCFQLLKGSTITMKNGTIKGNDENVKMIIQNYCNLTLEDMILDATKGNNNIGYVLSNNCGNVVLTGKTNITANENGTAFDAYFWPGGSYTDGVTVTFDENMTGTITGPIECTDDNTSNVGEQSHIVIKNGTVNGNITGSSEGSISITGGTVTGNVTNTSAGSVAISDDAKIEGNVSNDSSSTGSVLISNGATVTGSVSNSGSGSMAVVNSSVGSIGEGAESKITFVNSTVNGQPQEDTAAEGVVALVGGQTYNNLSAAVDAAAGTSDHTVLLMADVTESVTIESGETVVLDLNGYTLQNAENSSTSGADHTIVNNGDLTIRDTSDDGSGVVDNVTHAKGALVNYGTAILESGTFTRSAEAGTSPSESGDNSWYVIDNHGTMTIDGATVESTGKYSSLIRNIKVDEDEKGVLNVKSGNLSNGFIALKNDTAGTLNITGGTITSADQAVQNWNKATISGGELIGSVYSWSAGNGDSAEAGELTISGEAKIKGNVYAVQYKYDNVEPSKSATINITGGYIEGEVSTATSGYDPGATLDVPSKVTVSGGNFSNPVKEDYLSENLRYEAKDSNSTTPYSYHTSIDDAIEAAGTTGTIRVIDDNPTSTHTVIFDYNYDIDDYTVTVVDGDRITLPNPIRSGYDFEGWYVNGARYNAGAEVEITEDMTFTADWDRRSSGSSSGGGSSSSSNRYTVSVDSGIDNGSISVSPSRAERGDTVTITIDPDEGYELDSLTVRDSRGNRIDVERQSDTRYTFEMPSGRVTVDASFTEVAETPETPDQIGSFTDVDTDDWFADAVQYMLDNGMMNGVTDTTFGPGTTTTRGMIVTILYRLEGEPDTTASSFTDAASGMYYADAVAWAQANSIVTGITETIFAPDQAITREQMAAILYRYAQYKGYDVTASNDLSSYTDASRISAYATTAMQWANAEGLITGNTSTTINPTGNATRAEVATILMRFCETVTK